MVSQATSSRLLHLVEHVALQHGVDVAEEHVLATAGSGSGMRGLKDSNTFRSVQIVSRELRS